MNLYPVSVVARAFELSVAIMFVVFIDFVRIRIE